MGCILGFKLSGGINNIMNKLLWCKKPFAKLLFETKQQVSKWKEFFSVYKFSKPYKSEAKRRLFENIQYFQLNYAWIDAIILIAVAGFAFECTYALILALFFLIGTRRLMITKNGFYPISFSLSLTGILSLYLAWEITGIYIIVSGTFTLAHSLYHDYPISNRTDP
jgi:PRA1 family protein